MREILFCGKRKDNGKWVEGYLLETFLPAHKVFIVESIDISVSKSGMTIYDSRIYEVIPETVGQYTGLTDKNGTKIFEGDIVEYKDERAAIQWDADTARYIVEFDSYLMDFDSLYGHEVEVIGNIHDNPELLGGTE